MDNDNWQTISGKQINNQKHWEQLTQQAFFPILNVAIGNNLYGKEDPNDKTATGDDAAMVIKWVKFLIKG